MAPNPPVETSEEYEMGESLLSESSGTQRKDMHISGAVTNIWLAAAIAAIPMLLLSATLLGLTFAYRLDQADKWFRSADSPNASSDTSAYYLSLSSTRLVTVASWSSTVAPLLSTFILALFSYRVSLVFWSASKENAILQYPTPFQLNLLVQAFSGGLTPLVNLGKYRLWEKRKRLPATVKSTYWMLLVTLLLGYAVWGADTWLHVTTSAVNVARSNTNTSAYNSYGRTLHCTPGGYNSITDSCSTSPRGLQMTTEAFWTLNNLSSSNAISTFQIEEDTYAYLTSPIIARGVDYEASTYAIQTQCATTPNPCEISCRQEGDLEQVDYSCNDNLQGTLIGMSATVGDMNTSFIYLSSDDPATAQEVPYTRTNPFSFATVVMTESFSTLLESNQEQLILCQGSEGAPYIVWMVVCNATIYDVDYKWANGTFEGVVSKNLSNTTLAGTLSTPFGTNVGRTTIWNAALTASGEGDPVSLARTFSLVFSKTAMALAAGVTEAISNTGEGETLIGTRVEKAPLFTLLSLNLLYAVLAIGLLLAALKSEPSRTEDIRTRLSVVGLVAQCFEGERADLPVSKLEKLFAEWEGEGVQRVGVVETDKGGWKYKTFKQE